MRLKSWMFIMLIIGVSIILGYMTLRTSSSGKATTVLQDAKYQEPPSNPTSEGGTTYVYGARLIASKDNIMTYHVQDNIGSNRLTTTQSGAIKSKYAGYPYGKTLFKASMSEGKQKYTYTGKEDDGHLMYFHARYLDPRTGRFNSVDPIPRFISPYEYTDGNPLTQIDPDGKQTVGTLKIDSRLPPMDGMPGNIREHLIARNQFSITRPADFNQIPQSIRGANYLNLHAHGSQYSISASARGMTDITRMLGRNLKGFPNLEIVNCIICEAGWENGPVQGLSRAAPNAYFVGYTDPVGFGVIDASQTGVIKVTSLTLNPLTQENYPMIYKNGILEVEFSSDRGGNLIKLNFIKGQGAETTTFFSRLKTGSIGLGNGLASFAPAGAMMMHSYVLEEAAQNSGMPTDLNSMIHLQMGEMTGQYEVRSSSTSVGPITTMDGRSVGGNYPSENREPYIHRNPGPNDG